jgi:hypothetical protein
MYLLAFVIGHSCPLLYLCNLSSIFAIAVSTGGNEFFLIMYGTVGDILQMTPSVRFHAQKQRQNHKGPIEAVMRVREPSCVFGGKKSPLLVLFSKQPWLKLHRDTPHFQAFP